VGQGMGRTCHRELSPIGDSERALLNQDFFKTFSGSFASVEPILGNLLGLQHLKLRLQLQHVQVHATNSAKVIKIPMTAKTHSLTGIAYSTVAVVRKIKLRKGRRTGIRSFV
jgi:hypothetical protein